MSVSIQCSPLSSFILLQSCVFKKFLRFAKGLFHLFFLSLFKMFILFFDCTGSSSLFKGFSLVVVCGLLNVVTSLVAEHGL